MSSVGSFFSYVNDARSHEPEISTKFCRRYCATFNDTEKCVAQQSTSVAVLIVGRNLLIYYVICLERLREATQNLRQDVSFGTKGRNRNSRASSRNIFTCVEEFLVTRPSYPTHFDIHNFT